jgi:hypothetical protein
MRPDPPNVLMGIANALLVQLAPEVRTPFGQWKAALAGLLAFLLAQEADRLVDRLHRENQAVATLLGDATPLLADEALRARAGEAAAHGDPADLRVSTLQALNDRLRTVLVDVHAAIEEMPGPGAAAMDARIWSELVESTSRRHVELPV